MIGDNLLSASNLSTNAGYAILTDSLVSGAGSVQGLRNAINNAAVHADYVYVKDRFNLAITLGTYDGSITDARISGVSTVAGLIALTYAQTTDSIQQQVPE